MVNRYKHVFIFVFLWLNMPLFCRVQSINLESPFKNSWYKKALDACMHVWGDVRALSSMQQSDMNLRQRTLYFDALIGRLTQADMYVERLINGKAVVEEDDIAYLVHILGLLNHACRKLGVEQDGACIGRQSVNMDEQMQCMLAVLHGIKKRLETVLGPEFILSKIEQMQN